MIACALFICGIFLYGVGTISEFSESILDSLKDFKNTQNSNLGAAVGATVRQKEHSKKCIDENNDNYIVDAQTMEIQ